MKNSQEQYGELAKAANARLEAHANFQRGAGLVSPAAMIEKELLKAAEPKPANEMAILRRVLKALEPLDWQAKLRVLDYVRNKAAGGVALAGPQQLSAWAPR